MNAFNAGLAFLGYDPRMSAKQKLVETVLSSLRQELDHLTAAAKAAHEAATHEESKAEDSHDTRGLEASYLAAGQLARIDGIRKVIVTLQQLKVRDFEAQDPIQIGAWVKLELNGKRSQCLLVGQGGGVSVVFEGETVQVITPQAPLGDSLLGRRVGEVVEVEAHKSVREYKIISVR